MEQERDLEIDGLAPDSTILIAGPPMTGKFELLLRLLAAHTERSIIVSTKYGAGDVLDQFDALSGKKAQEPAVIDCVTDHTSATDSAGDNTVRYVESPGRLTRIGIEFTDLANAFEDNPDDGHVGVGFHSVTSLVMQTDIKQIYQFLQVLFGQTRGLDWLGLAVVDTGGIEDADAKLLQHHFDGLVETRMSEDGVREFRVRGLTPTISDWRSF